MGKHDVVKSKWLKTHHSGMRQKIHSDPPSSTPLAATSAALRPVMLPFSGHAGLLVPPADGSAAAGLTLPEHHSGSGCVSRLVSCSCTSWRCKDSIARTLKLAVPSAFGSSGVSSSGPLALNTSIGPIELRRQARGSRPARPTRASSNLRQRLVLQLGCGELHRTTPR